ncbi:MAG: hypothetical protein JRH15_23570 [Deltaproteobacteria bacterium]|nr:hypothetical protein [Deltaproteobacteria bacterium]
MAKQMVIDYGKCHGCRECETACAMICALSKDSSRPRITPVTWELEGFGVPVTCQHCQDPPCMVACPKDAIYRDEDLNRWQYALLELWTLIERQGELLNVICVTGILFVPNSVPMEPFSIWRRMKSQLRKRQRRRKNSGKC